MSNRVIYLACAGCIFLLEIAIAKGLLGLGFVRGSVGDILVIMLIYAFLRGTVNLQPGRTALLATAFGFVVETLQYFHFADMLGLKRGSIWAIVIGTTFSFSDLLMYCIGGALAFAMDYYFLNTIHRP